MTPSYFSGNKRLEHFAPLARKMRMGAPDALRISDHDIFLQTLAESQFESADEYLGLFHAEYQNMLLLLLEWALQMPETMAALTDTHTEKRVTKSCIETFQSDILSLKTSEPTEQAINVLLMLFTPQNLRPTAAASFRAGSQDADAINLLLKALASRYGKLKALIVNQHIADTKTNFIEYTEFVRTLHDGLVSFVSRYSSDVYEKLGQNTSEKLIQHSFAACSFFEPLWSLGQLPPDALAAFLAEHLRFHFSGESRKGSVDIIEEDDKYRLVFDACGSGGALRRRADNNLTKLPEASPATWGLTAKVPAYCSHCAFNEMTSIDKFGYPIFVTEFDPDPDKPCGWTIYKNPVDIPESFYTRVGKTKDDR